MFQWNGEAIEDDTVSSKVERLRAGSEDHGAPPRRRRPHVSLLVAYRNLVHDRASLAVTIIGIVFSVVLVTVQCGLYLGSVQMIAAVQDHAGGDLWIIPFGTQSFDDPSLLQGHEKYAALGTPGVAKVEELVVDFGGWQKPGGGVTAVLVVGFDHRAKAFSPWDIVEGTVKELAAPAAISVDKSYLADLGIEELGDSAEINGIRAKVVALSDGIRSFTTLPYVFASLGRARSLLSVEPDQATYLLVDLKPGADIDRVSQALRKRLPDAEVLTHAEFRNRGLNYWLFQTGAGAALIAGAVLGLIVGLVIVAQTLYASTKDHLNEFATMRALGSSAGYIQRIILMQAVMSAVLGYSLGIVLSYLLVEALRHTDLMALVTPELALMMFALTLAMCVGAAFSAILKVTRIDPAGVFNR